MTRPPATRTPVNSAATRAPVPICNPVAGSTGQLNRHDPSRGQGDGRFQAPRDGGRTHNGIDITGRVGTPIYATGDGRVIHSGPGGGGAGNAVVIRHADGTTSHSYHLRGDAQPAEGTRVNRGDRIGTLGRTGNVPRTADGHLHHEERSQDGQPLPPVLNGQRCEPRPAPTPRRGGATPAR